MGFFDFFKKKKVKPEEFLKPEEPKLPDFNHLKDHLAQSAKNTKAKKKIMARFSNPVDKKDSGKRGPFKLEKEAQLDLCKQIACYQKSEDIIQHILKVYGHSISENLVRYYSYSKKWRPLINKYREEYSQAVLEVAVANKRYRLEKLQNIFEEYVSFRNLKGAVETLKEARAEMEGDKKEGSSVYFTQINQTSYNRMSDEDIERERMKQLDNIKRVRGLLKRSEAEHGIEETEDDFNETEEADEIETAEIEPEPAPKVR